MRVCPAGGAVLLVLGLLLLLLLDRLLVRPDTSLSRISPRQPFTSSFRHDWGVFVRRCGSLLLAGSLLHEMQQHRVHWPTDVIAGAVLGGITAVVTRRLPV